MSWLFDSIEIPFPEVVETTPDLGEITSFYPQYATAVRDADRTPTPFPGYLWAVCKEAAQRNTRGRDADTWQRRWLEHFGMSELVNLQGGDEQLKEFAHQQDVARLIAKTWTQ